jgi:4-amino-4-deoxy-L-arabinose transferase-like glycosyltransferase
LTPPRVLLALALYFALAAVARVLVSDSAELDESEQLVLTQAWRLGYGSQPPLYTWLQALAFAVGGVNIATLAAVKALLLFGLYLFTYLAARECTGDNERSLVAALGLMLVPQIAWESQRDLTHSVLATTLAAAALWQGLKMLRTGRVGHFAVFGALAGLGTLSKYNFTVFLAAFAAAALTRAPWRRRLLRPALVLAALVGLAITGPHGFWVWDHVEVAMRQFGKLHAAGSSGGAARRLHGLADWARYTALFIAPVAAIGYLASRRLPLAAGGRGVGRESEELPVRLLTTGLLIAAVVIVVFAANIKQRWLMPLQFLMPLCLVILLRDRWQPALTRRLAGFAAAAAVLVLTALPAIPALAFLTQRPTRLNHPYTALAARLRVEGIEPVVIAADSRLTGGNLRLFFPGAVVLVPEFPELPAPVDAAWLVVWDANRSASLPEPLAALLAARRGAGEALPPVRTLDVPYKYCATRSMKFACALIPPVPENKP